MQIYFAEKICTNIYDFRSAKTAIANTCSVCKNIRCNMLKAQPTCNFDSDELSKFLIRFPFQGNGNGRTPVSISSTKICTEAAFALTRAHARKCLFSPDNRARKIYCFARVGRSQVEPIYLHTADQIKN